MDFFVVPTATFRLFYVLVVMNHERRKIVHFKITDAPTAAWSAQQIINAFPDDTAPEYLLRDNEQQLFQAQILIDFFAVPTATFRVLFVFMVLARERRRVLHPNITDSPSAAWTAQ